MCTTITPKKNAQVQGSNLKNKTHFQLLHTIRSHNGIGPRTMHKMLKAIETVLKVWIDCRVIHGMTSVKLLEQTHLRLRRNQCGIKLSWNIGTYYKHDQTCGVTSCYLDVPVWCWKWSTINNCWTHKLTFSDLLVLQTKTPCQGIQYITRQTKVEPRKVAPTPEEHQQGRLSEGHHEPQKAGRRESW